MLKAFSIYNRVLVTAAFKKFSENLVLLASLPHLLLKATIGGRSYKKMAKFD